ncbi:ankyrin repeat domain-containing protein, partial [Campylobacter lari]|uniref:ankyrin repeat domain-containing protein n=1 Tax=Campylobacter lari TaxID=201 RepID=UPI001BD4D57A
MTKEKIISYEEVQANPMLKWFFDREIKHSIKDKYYKEWQEYVKKIDLNTIYITEDPKGKDIYDLYPIQRPTIAYYLFCLHKAYDHEFHKFILQFVKDQTWLNFLLACVSFEIDDDHIDLLEKTKKIIKLLVDKGANINASFYNSNGQYKPLIFQVDPLGFASKTERANKLELLHFLLELGADPNLKNSKGENLLHRFILSEEQKFANALIDSGKIKDINEIIEYNKGAVHYGESALILAVEECYSNTVKKLIEAGANVNVLDHFGNSALDLIENKSETIKKYLL